MDNLYQITSTLTETNSALDSIKENLHHLSYIDSSLSSISSDLSTISFIMIGIVVFFVINDGWKYFKDKKIDVKVDNAPRFYEFTVFGTEQIIMVNPINIIKVEPTDSGRAKITLGKGSELELIELSETFKEIQEELLH